MLRINNLSVSFSEKPILSNLSTDFPDASIIGIIGKNGTGKSTLLKAIENLVNYNGDIELDNINLNTLSIKQRAKLISYLPQNRPIIEITAELMIEHGRFPYLSFSKTINDEDKNIINDAIKKTGVKDLLNKKLSQVSGGELQKIYIASTIVQQTKVILLDEPTNHLDLESQIEILNLLKDLKNDKHIIIIVLHDLLQAFTFCDKIIVLNEHKIALEGKPIELIKRKEIQEIFKYQIIEEKEDKAIYRYKLIK